MGRDLAALFAPIVAKGAILAAILALAYYALMQEAWLAAAACGLAGAYFYRESWCGTKTKTSVAPPADGTRTLSTQANTIKGAVSQGDLRECLGVLEDQQAIMRDLAPCVGSRLSPEVKDALHGAGDEFRAGSNESKGILESIYALANNMSEDYIKAMQEGLRDPQGAKRVASMWAHTIRELTRVVGKAAAHTTELHNAARKLDTLARKVTVVCDDNAKSAAQTVKRAAGAWSSSGVQAAMQAEAEHLEFQKLHHQVKGGIELVAVLVRDRADRFHAIEGHLKELQEKLNDVKVLTTDMQTASGGQRKDLATDVTKVLDGMQWWISKLADGVKQLSDSQKELLRRFAVKPGSMQLEHHGHRALADGSAYAASSSAPDWTVGESQRSGLPVIRLL